MGNTANFILCGLIAGCLIGIPAGIALEHYGTKQLAIEHACGQYNPKTGNFEWVDVVNPDPMGMKDFLPEPPKAKPKAKGRK